MDNLYSEILQFERERSGRQVVLLHETIKELEITTDIVRIKALKERIVVVVRNTQHHTTELRKLISVS